MDPVDELLAQWRRVRPDLDPEPLALVGRVLILAHHLERRVNAALSRHGLTLGQFDILATLRRAEPDHALTPTALRHSVMLSSGGMTNRLDRLERLGLIRRRPDPSDRRGVIVALTPRGRQRIDAATSTRFDDARRSLPPLPLADQRQLAAWLRTWLLDATHTGE